MSARLADATRRIELARNRAREASVIRTEAGEAILRAQTEHARLGQEREAIEAIIGPEAGRTELQQDLVLKLSSAKEQFDAVELRAGPLRRTGRDLAGAEAALARARSVADAAGCEIARLREELADIGGQIRTRSDSAVEENWLESRDLLAAAREQVKRFETEVGVLDRLRKALTATRAAARDLYLKPVMSELAPLLGLLFDDISITFDGDTLLPQIVRRNGLDEDVDRLSGGMREQLGADPPCIRKAACPRWSAGACHPRRCACLFRRRPDRANVRCAAPPVTRPADPRLLMSPTRLRQAGRQRAHHAAMAAGIGRGVDLSSGLSRLLIIVEADVLAAMENTQDRYDVLFHHKRDACLAAIPNDAQSRPQVVTHGASLGKRLKAEAVIHNLTDVVASRLRPGLVYQVHQQVFEVVARLGRKNDVVVHALRYFLA